MEAVASRQLSDSAEQIVETSAGPIQLVADGNVRTVFVFGASGWARGQTRWDPAKSPDSFAERLSRFAGIPAAEAAEIAEASALVVVPSPEPSDVPAPTRGPFRRWLGVVPGLFICVPLVSAMFLRGRTAHQIVPTTAGWLSLRSSWLGSVGYVAGISQAAGGPSECFTHDLDPTRTDAERVRSLADALATAAGLPQAEAQAIAAGFLAGAGERSRRATSLSPLWSVFLVVVAFLPVLVLVGIGVGIWLLVS